MSPGLLAGIVIMAYVVGAIALDSMRNRFAAEITEISEYDRQTVPRRSVRTLAMLLLLAPVFASLQADKPTPGARTLSVSFLSTTAQVLPALFLALAVQAGIAFSRTAGPLANRRVRYKLARDYRWFYVVGGGPIPRFPLPKAQTAAFLSLVFVFAWICRGEVVALRSLASCKSNVCAVGKSNVADIVSAYVAAGSLIVALLIIDLVPRIIGLRWEAESADSSRAP